MKSTLKATSAALLALGLAILMSPAASFAEEVSALFKTKCAACHGADGKGETPVGKANKLRDLGSPEVQQQSDAELTAIVSNGKNKMPAYQKSLKPEQIKDLVGFVRSLKK
jgi:mono/diheme cytochrome c family protein